MKIAAVIIDTWKRGIFEQYLKDANYKYHVEVETITPNTLTLKVQFETVPALQKIIANANQACLNMKLN